MNYRPERKSHTYNTFLRVSYLTLGKYVQRLKKGGTIRWRRHHDIMAMCTEINDLICIDRIDEQIKIPIKYSSHEPMSNSRLTI